MSKANVECTDHFRLAERKLYTPHPIFPGPGRILHQATMRSSPASLSDDQRAGMDFEIIRAS
jgi:hypothetical protein